MSERTPVIGLSVDPSEVARWVKELTAAMTRTGVDWRLAPEADPAEVDYLVYNVDGGLTEFSAYPRLKAILNTWAGVEAAVKTVDFPKDVPFVRMVETGMTEGMTEYFVAHTLRYHWDIDRAIRQSTDGVWEKWSPQLARYRQVGILGLGQLGASTGAALAGLGFQVLGWSRSQKDLPGIDCHSGEDGLAEVLSRAEILILILPSTPATENILNAESLARMPKGACVINAGRGPLIDDDALLAALASGQIRHATLDVFRTEPLPPDHPYWRHPGVTVTPHIAAETRFDTASDSIVAQIGREIAGQPLLHVVEPDRGY